MPENAHAPKHQKPLLTGAEMNIAELTDFAQHGLDLCGIEPTGEHEERKLEGELPRGQGILKEAVDGETGLRDYEYSETRSTHREIYRWAEGDSTIAKFVGSVAMESEPTFVRKIRPSTTDIALMRRRINGVTQTLY